jgi:hypothetical protein
MKLAILITANLEGGMEVAQSWRENGAPGVTIVRSHGLHTLTQTVERGEIELPRMVVSIAASMAYIIDQMDYNTLIVLSVVDDDAIDRLVRVAEKVLGDLYAPHTGVMLVLDVLRAIGVRDHRAK